MSSARGRGRFLLFTGLTALLSLAVVETFARLVVPAPWLRPRDPAEDPLIAAHSVRGYGLRANLTRHWTRDDFDVEIRLNSTGHRDEELAEARRAALRVLAVGDSFTFGIGVEHGECWTERLEAALRERVGTGAGASVYDAGVPGYSAAQIRQTIEELLLRLDPRVVVIGVYANSYWRVENPYLVRGGALMPARVAAYVEATPEGELVATAFDPGWARELDLWLKSHLHVGAHALSLVHRLRHLPRMPAPPLDEPGIRRAYQPALAEISRANAFVRAHGARLVVMAINGQQADGTFLPVEHIYNRILAEHCAREGIAFVDPLPELERSAAGRPVYRYPHDLHWTPDAHAVAAGLLRRRLDEEGLLGPTG